MKSSMAGSLNDIVRMLSGTRDGVLPSIATFSPLDVEQVARELRLESSAKANGERGIPRTTSTTPDSDELRVDAEITRRAAGALETFESQKQIYESRIRRALLTSDQRAQIELAGRNAISDYQASIDDDREHLHIAAEEVRQHHAALEQFKHDHALRRPAHVLSPVAVRVRIAVLVVLILLESIFNGVFFAEGSEAGLVGGVAWAITFSLLNNVPAFCFGAYGFGYVRHRRAALQFVGGLLAVLFVVWLITLNLLIGHFRDIFVSTGGAVPMESLRDVMRTPWLYADAKSAVLALLGIFFGAIAFFDGHSFNDEYPGYSRVARTRRRAMESYERDRSKCLNGMTSLRDASTSSMTDALTQVELSASELGSAKEHRARLHASLLSYLDHLASARQQLIRLYRDHNCSARLVAPPNWFDAPASALPIPIPPALPALGSFETDSRSAVIEKIMGYINEVNEHFERALTHYDKLDQLTRNVN